MDTMMASHISALSVSAVAYLNQLNQILSAIGNGLAVGSGILISRAYGTGDYQLVKKRVSTLYAIALTSGMVILVCILPIVGPFLKFCGTPDELITIGSFLFSSAAVCHRTDVHECRLYFSGACPRQYQEASLSDPFVIMTKLILTAVFVYILNGDLVMIAYASLASQALDVRFGNVINL